MSATDAEGTPMLRERSLEVRHAVITSLAVVTPTAAIFFLTIPAALNAGKAMPFAFLVAFIAVLLIVNAIYRFTQRVAHAGSFFAFVRAGLVLGFRPRGARCASRLHGRLALPGVLSGRADLQPGHLRRVRLADPRA